MYFGKIITIFLVMSSALAGSIVFAMLANTTWNNPDMWVRHGSVISTQDIVDNFIFLKEQHSTNVNFSNPPLCTGARKTLQWNGEQWLCYEL